MKRALSLLLAAVLLLGAFSATAAAAEQDDSAETGWTAYVVTLVADDGYNSTQTNYVYSYNDFKYTLPECPFKKLDYDFDKWDRGYPGEVITITEDTTITALWKKSSGNNTIYLVSFDANGGTGSQNYGSAYGSKDFKYILPECTFTPPSGKVFDKWSLGKPGDVVTIFQNTTVQAIWKSSSSGGSGKINSVTLSGVPEAIAGESASSSLLPGVSSYNVTVIEKYWRDSSGNIFNGVFSVGKTYYACYVISKYSWTDVFADSVTVYYGDKSVTGYRNMYGDLSFEIPVVAASQGKYSISGTVTSFLDSAGTVGVFLRKDGESYTAPQLLTGSKASYRFGNLSEACIICRS